MMEQIGALVYNGISLRSIPLYTNAKTTNYSRKMCQVILTRSFQKLLPQYGKISDVVIKCKIWGKPAATQLYRCIAYACRAF
ncbi:MAG: hypothetical protein BWY74_03894 [Firmicutes bacterium ADurb.Bin419]|nr:MAG: hypothetical protein BWY74_03894 [Firmicutes bacterium ADurb.Bin419]